MDSEIATSVLYHESAVDVWNDSNRLCFRYHFFLSQQCYASDLQPLNSSTVLPNCEIVSVDYTAGPLTSDWEAGVKLHVDFTCNYLMIS